MINRNLFLYIENCFKTKQFINNFRTIRKDYENIISQKETTNHTIIVSQNGNKHYTFILNFNVGAITREKARTHLLKNRWVIILLMQKQLIFKEPLMTWKSKEFVLSNRVYKSKKPKNKILYVKTFCYVLLNFNTDCILISKVF